MGTSEMGESKKWTIADAGMQGATQLVYIRSPSGHYLEDWRGTVGLSSDWGAEQKWIITDAPGAGATPPASLTVASLC